MVFIGSDGYVNRIENVLTEGRFARISKGMTEAQVLRLIGAAAAAVVRLLRGAQMNGSGSGTTTMAAI